MSTNQGQKLVPKLCTLCKDMYGNPVFNDMCSKCFKESKNKDQKKQVSQLILKKKQTQLPAETKQIVRVQLDFKPMRKNYQPVKQQKQETQQVQQKQQIEKCFVCSKKTQLLGYKCRHCSSNFCKKHRLPEDHECKVDFVEEGKKKLIQSNPIVAKQKIQKI